mgnify:CR=1 FL=1
MPKLSFEALLAALTVVGAAGCAKQEAKAEPAPPAQAVATQSAAATVAAPPPPAEPAASVAPGIEMKKPAAAPRKADKGNAACGAGSCSEEMKK